MPHTAIVEVVPLAMAREVGCRYTTDWHSTHSDFLPPLFVRFHSLAGCACSNSNDYLVEYSQDYFLCYSGGCYPGTGLTSPNSKTCTRCTGATAQPTYGPYCVLILPLSRSLSLDKLDTTDCLLSPSTTPLATACQACPAGTTATYGDRCLSTCPSGQGTFYTGNQGGSPTYQCQTCQGESVSPGGASSGTQHTTPSHSCRRLCLYPPADLQTSPFPILRNRLQVLRLWSNCKQ